MTGYLSLVPHFGQNFACDGTVVPQLGHAIVPGEGTGTVSEGGAMVSGFGISIVFDSSTTSSIDLTSSKETLSSVRDLVVTSNAMSLSSRSTETSLTFPTTVPFKSITCMPITRWTATYFPLFSDKSYLPFLIRLGLVSVVNFSTIFMRDDKRTRSGSQSWAGGSRVSSLSISSNIDSISSGLKASSLSNSAFRAARRSLGGSSAKCPASSRRSSWKDSRKYDIDERGVGSVGGPLMCFQLAKGVN